MLYSPESPFSISSGGRDQRVFSMEECGHCSIGSIGGSSCLLPEDALRASEALNQGCTPITWKNTAS